VVVNPKPIVNLGPDLEIPPGIKKALSNSIQFGPIEEYKWTPSTNLSCDNCPIPIADIKKNITYNLKVRNVNGCIGEDTINIKTLCEQKQIFIPNAFTPESGTDPLNKSFFVSSLGLVTIKSIRVFTRWGELVFEKFNISTNDPSAGWNGQIRGVTSKTDVFVYAIEVVCENGAIFSFKGNVTLLR
jgi:gliding motility-associated-like protein